MEGTKRYKETLLLSVAVGLYMALSLFYFRALDSFFYVKNLFNSGIIFVFPVPYLLLIAAFVYIYSSVAKTDPRRIAYPVFAMAILFSLIYLLTELKIGMVKTNPFQESRRAFDLYSSLYYTAINTIFCLWAGAMFRKADVNPEDLVFQLPMLTTFLIIEAMLFIAGQTIYALLFLIIFILGLLSAVRGFTSRAKAVMARFMDREKLLLLAIFLLAFLIRYWWGMRVVGILGDRFIYNSDDALSYDPFAATIAQGGIVPEKDAFWMSGFGYWYFLAAIYKLFGLHNFKAVVLVQSLAGAAVPVFTYLLAKRVFAIRLVPIIAAIMITLNFNLIFLSTVIGMEAIYVPLLTLAMLITVSILSVKRIRYINFGLMGMAFGAANLIRPEVLFFPLVLAALFYIFLRREAGFKKTALAIVAFFMGFALVILIQHIATYMMYGKIRLTSAALGGTFANSYGSPENGILDQMGFNPFKSVPDSIGAFLREPITVTTLLAKGFIKRNIIYYFKPNFGVLDPISLINPSSGYFFAYPVYFQLYGYLFIIGGLLHAFFRDRTNLLIKTILFIYAPYLSTMYGFVWVTNPRHRGVLAPIFLTFFAYGIAVFYKKLKTIHAKE